MSDIASELEAGRIERPAEIRIWDLAVRVFHWSLVALFATAWITADEWDRAHELAGYGIAALVLFRIVWGIVGTRHARFSDFVRPPGTVLAYLRDTVRFRARRYLGHNPAGGAMVIALLATLALVAATGYMQTTTFWGVEWVEEVHEVAANLTLVLVLAHVAGVVLASFKHGENLIKSMVTGTKRRAP